MTLLNIHNMNELLFMFVLQLALANPRWHVIHKLRLANFLKKIEGRIFLTIGEAIEACLTSKNMLPI